MKRALRLLFVVSLCATFVTARGQDRRGPFTHEKRSVRSREVDQEHIRLDLKLDWDKLQVEGRATLNLVAFRPLKSITLDAADMQIKRVARLNPEPSHESSELKYETKPSQLVVELDREFQPGEKLTLVVDYVLTRPRRGLHFVVPDESEKNQPRMAWTQSEPEYARYWFPCIDSSADRLTSEIIATVPGQYLTLSNGDLVSKQQNADGTQTWHWSQKHSHVPYLFSIVSGEFDAFEQEWHGIPVISYVPKGQREWAARSFEKTPKMMEFFSRKIGVSYPWSKYAQICVDEYQWGGMEHTSATTLNKSTLHDERAHLDVSSDNLVAHELVHQWFGDLLTCKDWGEIWLNESFATYFATLWTEEDLGWDEATWARYQEAEEYKAEDQRYRRSIVNYQYTSPDNVFDSHAYPKGGRVLHMLRFVLGEEMFWRAIQHYTGRNVHRTVETADLRIAIEEATGQGLNWFFDQWVYHGGHPQFHVEWDWDAAARTVRVTVKQTQPIDSVTPLFRTPVEIEIATPDKTMIRRVELSKPEETFHFDVDQRPTRVCFDPRDWLLMTLDFPQGKAELLDQLARDEHMMCRVRAARGLSAYDEDADARSALSWAARKDRFWAVRQEAVKSLGKFSGDQVRQALLEASRDEKSFVRREAIKSLSKFKHEETSQRLREVVDKDPSYYAVAEALRSLHQVDRDQCADTLLAAVRVDSHNQQILKAALDGLVDLKESRAADPLAALLQQDVSPERRAVLLGGLARLKPDDPDVRKQLVAQLDNERRSVKREAIDALVALGDPASIAVLLDKRAQQETAGMTRAFDVGIEKLREQERSVEDLRKQLDTLRQQNRSLEERLRKLEADQADQ